MPYGKRRQYRDEQISQSSSTQYLALHKWLAQDVLSAIEMTARNLGPAMPVGDFYLISSSMQNHEL